MEREKAVVLPGGNVVQEGALRAEALLNVRTWKVREISNGAQSPSSEGLGKGLQLSRGIEDV
jgi:hypothetical protein